MINNIRPREFGEAGSTNYQDIFEKAESALIEAGKQPLKEYLTCKRKEFIERERQDFRDADHFYKLVEVIFYAGFKAATVKGKLAAIHEHFPDIHAVARYSEYKLDEILHDEKIIRNRRKVEKCVEMARFFQQIAQDNGSVQRYIDSFDPRSCPDGATRLWEELKPRLGPLSSLHYLMEMGVRVLKPDRVLMRIFHRLGLIDGEKPTKDRLLLAITHGREFADRTGHPIRYIDLVFVLYGQKQPNADLVDDGICLSNDPRCSLCGVVDDCHFEDRHRLIELAKAS